MQKEKLEQLRIVFRAILNELIREVNLGSDVIRFIDKSQFYTNLLLYEVKFRINNK